MPEYGLPLKFQDEKPTGKVRSVEYQRDHIEFYTAQKGTTIGIDSYHQWTPNYQPISILVAHSFLFWTELVTIIVRP